MNRNQSYRQEMTFRDVYRALFRHRKKAFAVFLLVMTATVLITLLTPKAYVSQSKLFVRLGRENAMLDSTATLGKEPAVAVPVSRESEINSVAEMVGSRAFLEAVTDEIGPEVILEGLPQTSQTNTPDAPSWLEQAGTRVREWGSGAIDSAKNALSSSNLSPRDRAIEKLEKRLKVAPVRNTDVVLVSYEAPQPELAQRVVASLVDTYLEQHVRLNRTPGTYEFFAEHSKRLGDELNQYEEKLREVKTSTGLASIDQQRELIVTRMGRLEDDLLGVEAARCEAEAKVTALRETLAELPKEQVLETNTGVGNNGTDLIREKFFALQVKEKEASAIYTAEHPKLKAIREELAESQQIMDQQEATRTEVTTAPDATYEKVRLELTLEEPNLNALRAKSDSVHSQLADVRASLEALNANEILIAQLTREIELRETDYRKYAANLEQSRIDHAMQSQRMSNISIVQPASLQHKAVRPRKALNLALGLIVAVCGAFGVALAAEYAERSAPLPEEVEPRPAPPVLPSTSRIKPDAIRANGRR